MRGVTVLIAGALSVFLAYSSMYGSAYAQSAVQHSHHTLLNIESAVQTGEITPEEAVVQKLYAGFQPERVDARFFEETGPPIKCMTPVLIEFERIRDDLPLQTLMAADPLLEQLAPEQSEADQIYYSASGNFALHYVTQGRDAVPEEDTNGSGIPDYIERAAAMADSSYRFQVETTGYHDFLMDEPYVIRFQQTGFYGYTRITGGTTEIVINSSFTNFPENNHPEGNRYGSLYVTIAHEMKHAIQFAANQWEGDAGRSDWMEMDATMMEEVVHPDVDDYYNYLMRYDAQNLGDWDRNRANTNSIFGSPHRPVPGSYYHVSWMLYFYENYQLEFWKEVWDLIGEDWVRNEQLDAESDKVYVQFFDAIDNQLQARHSSLAFEHTLNHAWHASAGPLKSGSWFGFEDSDNYPNPDIGSEITVLPDSVVSESLPAKAARYYRVDPEEALIGQPAVRLESDDAGANMALIGYFHGGDTEVLQLSDPEVSGGVLHTTWNWQLLSEVVVVVVNNNRSQRISYDLHVESIIPEEEMVSYNYPNPFYQNTRILFSVNRSKHVKIEVFDAIGRRVQTLTDREYGAGFHSLPFKGNGLAAGVYFYRIITDEEVISNKMMLIN